ncbi:hypothetical protein EW146_g7363 [Bondarzewia mesenterica]|uniref:Uncharacterized protein n=1 Tax=Bondarzewia mesenterica TaxID=1095465 RepID=A0A4S4LL07_9AGAM|nr:hypothetical protein EW146_g7363 [Bondarzewia mesenterica]
MNPIAIAVAVTGGPQTLIHGYLGISLTFHGPNIGMHEAHAPPMASVLPSISAPAITPHRGHRLFYGVAHSNPTGVFMVWNNVIDAIHNYPYPS